MAIKIHPSDKYFSLCIRERNENKCEYCGKDYSEGRGLQCAHYESRGNYALRYDPINAFALCYFHHQQLDGSPIRFTEFYLEKRGQTSLDVLTELSRDLMRGKENRRNKAEIAEHYREEYESMLLKRSYGLTGWLEFVGWN